MKLKVLIGVLVFLIVVNLATIGSFVYIQWTKPSLPGPPFPPPPGLELDHLQHQQLWNMLQEFKKETVDMRRRIFQLENEVFRLMQTDFESPEIIDRKLEKIADIRLQISKKIINKLNETKEILLPEQQKRFYHLLMRSRPGMQEGRPPFPRGRKFPPLRRPELNKEKFNDHNPKIEGGIRNEIR